MKNVYLAGPMRGIANFNKPAFMAAALCLAANGYRVFNPVEETIKLYGDGVYEDNPAGDEAATPIDPRKVFFNDIAFICLHADAVVLLPGWERSKGATAERAIALALGLPVYDLAELVETV
jgi:nucleoside 2-deoxyribosyltransferase